MKDLVQASTIESYMICDDILDNEFLIKRIVSFIENKTLVQKVCNLTDNEYNELYDSMDLLIDWLDDNNIYETATELCSLLNEIAPAGMYFGVNEYSGTIGFYKKRD